MNKYQMELARLRLRAGNLILQFIEGEEARDYLLGIVYPKEDYLKEFVDQTSTHILHINVGDRVNKVAFRTEKEAQEYADRHNQNGYRYEAIPFAKERED